jgi:hypothetical protein
MKSGVHVVAHAVLGAEVGRLKSKAGSRQKRDPHLKLKLQQKGWGMAQMVVFA